MKSIVPRLFIVSIAALLLSACGTTPPTNFYTLNPQSEIKQPQTNKAEKIIIGVGPVDIAPYIDRNQIVTRSADTRLNLTEGDHWAAPLNDTISNVLAVNLSRLLPQTQAIVRPWPEAKVGYEVLIKIIQFDSDLAGNTQLKAHWAIQAGDSHDILRIAYADIEQASIGEDYAAIARNMSTALANLSGQIAAALEQHIK